MPQMLVSPFSLFAKGACAQHARITQSAHGFFALFTAAIGMLFLSVSMEASAHDDGFSVGISIGNPYPPAGRYYAPPLGYAPPQAYVFPPAAVYAPPPVVIYRHPHSRYFGTPQAVYPSAYFGGYPYFNQHDGYRDQYRRDDRRFDNDGRNWRREYRDDRRNAYSRGDGRGRGWHREDD